MNMEQADRIARDLLRDLLRSHHCMVLDTLTSHLAVWRDSLTILAERQVCVSAVHTDGHTTPCEVCPGDIRPDDSDARAVTHRPSLCSCTTIDPQVGCTETDTRNLCGSCVRAFRYVSQTHIDDLTCEVCDATLPLGYLNWRCQDCKAEPGA